MAIADAPRPNPSISPHTSTEELLRLRDRYVSPAFYQVTPVAIARARGATLVDVEGREYVDFAAGIGAMNLGHHHPEVMAAAHEQMQQATHLGFHVVLYEGYVRLCETLDEIFPGARPTKSILVNSGAEAVENALKIARVATGREWVIAFQNSFHGRTYGALSATGKTKPSRAPFLRSLATNILHLPYPYLYRPIVDGVPEAELGALYAGLVERALETQIAPEQVAAILVEPVQGEGGFVVPPADYLPRLRQICDRHGILLIADEVQTGFGRTGRMFAVEHQDVQPDLLVMSKSLGAGWPLGAVTGRADLMDALPVGSLGSTFGGHPVACAAARTMIDVMRRDDVPGRALRVGARIHERFLAMQQRFACIGDVRGLGAMQAMELVTDRVTKAPAADLTVAISEEACRRGLLTIKAGMHGNVIRTLAPLTIEDTLLEKGLDILEAAIETTLARGA